PPCIVPACSLVPLVMAGTYLVSLARNRQAFLGRAAWPEGAMAKAFFCLMAAGAVTAVFSAVALLAYVDLGSHRYLAPVLAWPIIFVIAAVSSSAVGRKAAYVVGVGIVAICASDLLSRGTLTP